MSYQGTERRQHRIYVTRNTEYHLRDGICVAVRDRSSRCFRDTHIALSLKLEGRIKISPASGLAPSVNEAQDGAAIFFIHRTSDGKEQPIATSRIESVQRPEKEDVLRYRTE